MSENISTRNKKDFNRERLDFLCKRLQEKPRFIQILSGPRQIGKTTLVGQALDQLKLSHLVATADDVQLDGSAWIHSQWQSARLGLKKILVLDEVQKIQGWSETVKKLWDEDRKNNLDMHVVLLGSADLLIESGLTESLTGRFEKIKLMHWSYSEMKKAFGFSLEEYIFYGGYPGSASLIQDSQRWKRYILDSIIETTVSKDILLLAKVEKPALLRRLFQLSCEFSSQILSYQKMIGHLQDVGKPNLALRQVLILNNFLLGWLVL